MSEQANEKKRSRNSTLLVAIAILILPLAIYSSSYFALTKVISQPDWEHRERRLPGSWAISFYWPMLHLEQLVTGKPVSYSYLFQSNDPQAGGSPVSRRSMLSKPRD